MFPKCEPISMLNTKVTKSNQEEQRFWYIGEKLLKSGDKWIIPCYNA